jgi:hypothetical protein
MIARLAAVPFSPLPDVTTMKTIFLLFCLVAAGLRAESVTIDLGSRGRLTLFFPGDWKFTDTDMAGTATLDATPTDGRVNASCHIVVTTPDQDNQNTKQRLKQRLEADCAPLAEQCVEGKARAKEFSLTSGFGFYCDFTDPELVGKPPEKGNYKNQSVGRIRLAPDVLVDIVISADGFKSEPYQQCLGAIEGMEYKRK